MLSIRIAGAEDLERARAAYRTWGYRGDIQPGDAVLLAERGGELAGVVRLVIEGGVRVLRGMQVAPHLQRQGIGTALLSKLVERLGGTECYCVANAQLVAFYDRAGFHEWPGNRAPIFLAERLAQYQRIGHAVILMRRAGTLTDSPGPFRMAESLVIRKVRENELAALLELYRHLDSSGAQPITGDVQQQWQAIIADPKLHYFVAEVAGRLVCTCTLTVVPNLAQGGRPYGVVENVVTHPDFRRRGIGTRLLKGALQFARECGCYKVMLTSGREQEATLKFYEQAGFTPGEKTGFVAKF